MGNLDKIISLKYLGKSNISISTALLIFYTLIANNFIGDLYAGQLSEFIKNNRYAKHGFGYLTMLLIIMEAGGVTDGWRASFYSLLAYSWFILTTKLDLQWNLAIIGLLIVGFMYENKMFEREKSSQEDQALEEKHRKKIRKENRQMRRIIIVSILTITIIGTVLYFRKKRVQYGGNFDVNKFLFKGCSGHCII